MVVAGEWFAMWQSATWNGQEAAFRFYVAVLAVLIFINQLDVDLPGTEPLASAPKASQQKGLKVVNRGAGRRSSHELRP
jgi:hypothetical protein